MVAIPRFYASEVECEEFCDRLKLVVCPHCRRVGTLNRHGYLKGYPEGSGHLKEDKVIRGRRFFCNGRGRRPGCGRTFSLLACEFLFGFVMVALTVWRLLRAFAGGEAPRAAFQASGSRQSKRAAYHVLRRFRQRRARLRTLLLRRCAAPDPPAGADLLGQTVAHLEAAFPGHTCPVAAFQRQMQVRFF